MAKRTYDMLIDIKRDIYEIIRLKPIDTGNRVRIRFSEDGKPVDLTGQTVKFMAIKPDKKGIYNFAEIVNAEAGEIEVVITNQMTAVVGELECEIEIEGEELITTLTFYITIERKLNDGNFIESTNEFTVLQKAIRDAYEAIELMEQKTDAKLEELQTEVTEAINDMNETTDTKLSQIQSQVDTAIRDMNSTTDTKLSELQSQVNSAIENMDNTTSNKLADLQRQVTTAISDMNSKADTKLSQIQSQADTKLSQIQSQVDNKLTDIQGQFDTLETRLTKKVNDKITEVTGTQNTLTEKVDAKIAEVSNTQNALTQKVDAKILELTNTVNGKLTEVTEKLKVVDTKITEVNGAVSNANSTVEKLKQDVATAIEGIDDSIAGQIGGKVNKSGDNMTGTLVLSKADNLLTLSTERAWTFKQGGTGAETSLDLVSATDGKAFRILEPSGEKGVYMWVSSTGTQLHVDGQQVYHEGRKPTPADIGALAVGAKAESAKVADNANSVAWNNVTGKPDNLGGLPTTGGTLTGKLVVKADNGQITAKRGVSNAIMTTSVNDGEFLFGGKTDDYTTDFIQHYIRVGANKLQYTTNGNVHDIYHTGRKPTPADIGALPAGGKAENAKTADRVGNMRFNWEFGSGNPTHLWGSSGNSSEMYVWNPASITVGNASYVPWSGIQNKPSLADGNYAIYDDQGTGIATEGRLHLGGKFYLYWGWCTIQVTQAGASAERTYKVPNCKRVHGITVSCYTNTGVSNFGEVAVRQTYSDGFTVRLYNSGSTTGAHYITYTIIGE